MSVEHIIAMAQEHNEFITLEDGYVYYAPTLHGAMSAAVLRTLADELDRRNAAWDAEVAKVAGDPPT